MTESANPLKKFFRQPALYIQLPSGGNYYPAGSVFMPPNKEIPVYPMTALDEITYRTADALFNGSAVAEVIKSCVPAIKDPWAIPSIDLNSLIIAIRIASNGNTMEIDSQCPECKEDNEFDLDLRTVLGSINTPNMAEPLAIGDLKIYFKPLTYKEINDNTLAQYEDQRLLAIIPESDLPDEEKIKRLNEAFLQLTRLTMNAMSSSISMIEAGDDVVVDPVYIQEYVRETDKDTFDRIRNHITNLREATELKPLAIRCRKCDHKYETPFTLNPSNFFGRAS